MVSLSPSSITAFSAIWQDHIFRFSSFSHCGLLEWQNQPDDKFFSFQLILELVIWLRLKDPFVSRCPREFCVSLFLGWILLCANTIHQHDLILESCTITSESPLLLSPVYSCVSFVIAAFTYVINHFITVTT